MILFLLQDEDVSRISDATRIDRKLVNEYLWVQRRNRAVGEKVTKFCEASWRFLMYFSFVLLAIHLLLLPAIAPWIINGEELWKNWPHHTVTPEMDLYYNLQLGCYLHQLLWTEISRSDALQMLLHHAVTILLLLLSYLTNFTRIGSYILLVHDSADIFLELGKVFNYIQRVKGQTWAGHVTDGFFFFFVVTFFVSRLVIYPRYLVYGFVVGASQAFGVWPGYYLFSALLLTLQGLHIFWFYLISRMIYRLFLTGVVEKDERSEDDDQIVEQQVAPDKLD